MQNAEHKQTRHTGIRLLLYWVGLIALLLLLTTATYTWFALSRTPRVSDMYVTISAPKGLEIALSYDAEDEDWGQLLLFDDMVEELATLKPCTWSELDGCFYAVVYGMDGRMTDQWTELNDEENANIEGEAGYYNKAIFYARSDTPVSVSLAEARVSEDGTESFGTYLIGTPVWNDAELIHDDGGQGAEYAVRIGLRITPIDENGEPAGDPVFYIYEPNCNGHADGTDEYLVTPNKDDGEPLVPEERLITQSVSTWTEVFPVQRTATLKDLGEFTSDNTGLFALKAGGMVKIEVYIWLEGQDADCGHLLSREAQILANIGFDSDYSGQSGLVEIPDEAP